MDKTRPSGGESAEAVKKARSSRDRWFPRIPSDLQPINDQFKDQIREILSNHPLRPAQSGYPVVVRAEGIVMKRAPGASWWRRAVPALNDVTVDGQQLDSDFRADDGQQQSAGTASWLAVAQGRSADRWTGGGKRASSEV
jgi:hypothetical protein